MQVWTSVKVIAVGHAREGQAGVVFGFNAATPGVVDVRFDSDLVVLQVNVADLQML